MQRNTFKILKYISKHPVRYSDLERKFHTNTKLQSIIDKLDYKNHYITRSKINEYYLRILEDDPLITITDEGLDALDDYRSEQFTFILLNAVVIAVVSWFMEFLLDLLVKFLKSLL